MACARLLAEVIGAALYLTKTTKTYVLPVEPDAMDVRINSNTGVFNRKKWTAENDRKMESWAVLLGAREGIKDNIMDALDLQYYEQVRDETLGFTTVTIRDLLNHVKTWCRMNATLRKSMKDEFFRGWESDEHITAFATRLNRGKRELAVNGVVITDDEIRDHYVIQMYQKGDFDKREMTEYEAKQDADKDWAGTKAYFEQLADEQEEYEQNTGGASKRAKYESAAGIKEADEEMGDELRKYIESLSSKSEESQEEQRKIQQATDHMLSVQTSFENQLKSKDNQIGGLVLQVKTLSESVAALTKLVADNNANTAAGGGGGGKGGGGRRRQQGRDKENVPPTEKAAACEDTRPSWLQKITNQGGYCWSCGFNPIGKTHTSATCKRKAPGHDAGATAEDRRGGSDANKPK